MRPVDEVDRLFDSFVQKDMPREEFRHRYIRATDPKRVKRELNGIVTKLKIDRGMRNVGN